MFGVLGFWGFGLGSHGEDHALPYMQVNPDTVRDMIGTTNVKAGTKVGTYGPPTKQRQERNENFASRKVMCD